MTKVEATTVLERAGERSTRHYLKGLVIEPGLTLNETAASIYRKLDGVVSLSDICKGLLDEYDVDLETIVADAILLAQELLDEGVVRVVGTVSR